MRGGQSHRVDAARAGRSTGALAVLMVSLLVGLLGAGLLTSATASAEDEDYLVATDITFAPFEFQNESGDFVGIDIDLIKEIAKDQNFNVTIKPLGFDAALQAVQANQADGVIAGMSITDERKKVFDFSEPYFESGVQMAVLDTNNDIKSYEDLRGKHVAVKNGTEGADFAESIKDKYGFSTVYFRRLGIDVRRSADREFTGDIRRLSGPPVRHRAGLRLQDRHAKGVRDPVTALPSTRGTTPNCWRSSMRA